MLNLRNYSCDICKISCNSAEQLRIHRSSKTHFKKCANVGIEFPVDTSCYDPMQQSPGSQSSDTNVCPMCFKKMDPADILIHKCESNELDYRPVSPQPPQSLVFANVSTPILRSEFHCSICNVSLCSALNYMAHVKGKKHLDKKNQQLVLQSQSRDDRYANILSDSLECLELNYSGSPPIFDANITSTGSGYYCNVCNLTLNSTPQLQDHISGRKHKSRSASAPKTPAVFAPIPKSPTNPFLPVNSTVCPVCGVPVGNSEMKHHADGKVHLYKMALLNLERVCNPELPEPLRSRLCITSFPSVYNNFSSKLSLLQSRLLQVCRTDGDVIFRLNSSETDLVAVSALVLALALVRENRKVNPHTFAAWICPQKASIPLRTSEVRSLAENIIVDPPRLANILRDSYSQDDKSLDLTEHDIAFSTPGGLVNLMSATTNVQRALCALILTDVEHCVDHDPTDALLSRFAELEINERPRIIFITTGLPPNWPIFVKFVNL